MEEKERYVIRYDLDYNRCLIDTEENQGVGDYIRIVKLLNQQDKRIKELEEDQALLTILISGIDNLMHDKDYRFKNDNGTWYSRQSCKDLTIEEVYQEIIDEINQLDSNFEILDKENQQLKQQLHDLPKKIVEDIEKNFTEYLPLKDKTGAGFYSRLNSILKKYGEKDESNND